MKILALITRWINRLILIVVVFFIIISVFAYFQRAAKSPPSIEKAPWLIQTYTNDEFRVPSRYYYAESVEYIEGVPAIKVWWSFDGERYDKHNGVKVFPLDEYGKVEIIRRH